MPVSPAMAEDLARAVATLYEEAELAILDKLRKALAAGIDSPQWAQLKLAALGNLSSAVREVIDALQADASGAVGQALTEAYERGQQAAIAELGALGVGQAAAAADVIPAAAAIDRLAAAVAADTGPVHLRILRVSMDAYRDVIARASAAPLAGGVTRRQAAQRALDQFAQRGITGFVDRAGRSWDMASYAEMAVRSAVGRAAVDAHTDRLQSAGHRLVVVSDAPEECPLCRKWERKVLTLDGPGGARAVEVEHATEDGRMVRVWVSGSLAEARSAGLMHPNCRHSVSAYLPGVTRRPPRQEDRASYEDTQRQRYYERQVRAWKRRAAAAMDDAARRKANASVRAYQAKIRGLVGETGLPRKYHREQPQGAR